MKRKSTILKITLIIAMVALLCASLTGCGLFGQLAKVKHVDVYADSGLEGSESEGYIAKLGKAFVLSVDWHNARVTSPAIEWHVVVEDSDTELPETDKNYTYTFSRADLGKFYEYYAVVEGIKSTKIKVTPVEADLDAPTVSSTSHTIVDGKIQQNILAEGGLQNIVLRASWNKDDIAQDLEIYVKWYVGNELKSENSDEFAFDVSGITDDCTFVVKVEIGYENKDGTKVSKSSSVTLVFVTKYDLAQKVTVVPDEENGNLKRIADDTYYIKGISSSISTIELSSTLLPETANQNADCVWSIRNGDRNNTLSQKSRSISAELSFGKNVIKASIGNVDSRQIIVYVMSYSVDSVPTDIYEHLTNKFIWQGDAYDTYISSQRDLEAYLGYVVAQHKTDDAFAMYLSIDSWRDIDVFKQKCAAAFQNGIDESGAFAYSIGIIGPNASIIMDASSVFGIPSGAYSSPVESYQTKTYLRYEEQSVKRTKLPADDYTEEMTVYNSNDLYRALSGGYKPKFEGPNAASLQSLYQKARDVLIKYISDDMTETEKVAAIYDWIVYNVAYDYAVAGLGNDTDVSKYNAFYLEGVFNDNRAVCDGKSKAFALLCGMEGIKALRIIGSASSDGVNFGGHAWNKVLVDANDDGEREWYVVDTTWGDVGLDGKGSYNEYLSYAYFLRTDDNISATHRSSMEQPSANTAYNTYKNTKITVNGAETDLYVQTRAELELLITYSKQNGGICLSVYIAGNVSKVGIACISVRDNEYVIYPDSIDF